MNLVIRIVTIFIFLMITHVVRGQEFEVPQNYILEENIVKYEKDIIRCVNWLEETPINQQIEKRGDANIFLLFWFTKSQNMMRLPICETIKFNENNPDLLFSFMGGMSIFVLENRDEPIDIIKANLSGLKSVIKVYKMGNGIMEDENIEKLIELDDRNELENWVREQIKK